MDRDNIAEISGLRLQHARECLNAAYYNFKADDLPTACNRAYYAVFHAMRAVLAWDGVDMKHHSGVISEFRRRYIKTGIFPSEMSDTVGDLFTARTGSDYDDAYQMSREILAVLVERAAQFVTAVENYLKTK